MLPVPQSVNEDSSLTFSSGGGNAIGVTDVDVAPARGSSDSPRRHTRNIDAQHQARRRIPGHDDERSAGAAGGRGRRWAHVVCLAGPNGNRYLRASMPPTAHRSVAKSWWSQAPITRPTPPWRSTGRAICRRLADDDPNNGWDIYGRTFSATGTLSPTPSGRTPLTAPDVPGGGDGFGGKLRRDLAIQGTDNADGKEGIYARRYTALANVGSSAWHPRPSTPERRPPSPACRQANSSSSGRARQDGTLVNIYGQRYNAAGTAGSEFLVNTTTANQPRRRCRSTAAETSSSSGKAWTG